MKRIKPGVINLPTGIFEITGASVPGARHLAMLKNNQDAYMWSQATEAPIGVFVVSDGNGSQAFDSKHEVGSSIGVKVFEQQLLENSLKYSSYLKEGRQDLVRSKIILPAQRKLLSIIDTLMGLMDESNTRVVGGYFLFTLLGVIVTPTYSYFFRVGDGKLYINGQEVPIPKFNGNMPPYPAYQLLSSEFDSSPELLEPNIDVVMSTAELNSFVLGTDGLGEMADAAGKEFPSGGFILAHPADIHSLDLFKGEDLYIHLKGANTPTIEASIQIHPITEQEYVQKKQIRGLIDDDCTLIALRRKEENE